MKRPPVWIVRSDMISAYGQGTEACWKGLLSGQTAIQKVDRFDTRAFHSGVAACVNDLKYGASQSLVMQLIERLFEGVRVPRDARLVLATTKGEIDLLEHSLNTGPQAVDKPPVLPVFLSRLRKYLGVEDRGIVVSAACASSATALALAASMIQAGDAECVLVVACDSVTEFVFSGFSSLMALDPEPARPFDRDRNGLSVGEGAAFALLMAEQRARTSGQNCQGEILGWGQSSDANHMTGPSRDGSGQALAIRKALTRASLETTDIGSVCAHGTGTVYNDSMEMKAIRLVFGDRALPVYSVKGGVGHTMGAAGLMEALISLRSLAEGRTPGVVNLRHVDNEARGLVSAEPLPVPREKGVLSTNSGFGGINAAVILGVGAGAA